MNKLIKIMIGSILITLLWTISFNGFIGFFNFYNNTLVCVLFMSLLSVILSVNNSTWGIIQYFFK
jgi:hypothetical protein